MPATRPNRLDNPLRKLRLILGDGETPITQEEFAARSGVSLSSLRAAEGGRRPLDSTLDQIALNLHAQWNPTLLAWFVLNTTIPFEKRYAARGLFDHQDPFYHDYTFHRLVERLFDIFGAASSEQRLALIVHLNKYLKRVASDFGIDVDLELTEPEWREIFDPVIWGKPLSKPVVILAAYAPGRTISPHEDAGGIFDFRSRRSFQPNDYPAKTEAEAEAAYDEIVRARTRDNLERFKKEAKKTGTYLGPKSEGLRKGNKKRDAKKASDRL